MVSLVGAGPGDPDLLTVRALHRLRDADVLFHDALVDTRLLELAPKARRYFVGKRAHRPSIAQGTIHQLMIRAARRGQRVVRLKCGDPFVLGRGGEEALALHDAGVQFEIVPGLSSAIAAPTLSGIPITHRGLASAFTVLSGHSADAYTPILGAIMPGTLTLVVLMGLGNRSAIAAFLIERGWPATTPSAIILGASTTASATWRGTLADLGNAAPDTDRGDDRPGILVIGRVVSVAAALAHDPLDVSREPVYGAGIAQGMV
jgi:uroporphyrin-III C-methyltransferase/precorrin-2 dehydrogenase/sirohydrochlorin ferrochelatase